MRARRGRATTSRSSRASLVQVTNLGITRQGQPAEHAASSSRASTPRRRCRARASRSSCRTARRVWTGTTGADGVAIAPQTRLRNPRRLVTSSPSSSRRRRTATSPTSAATGTTASCRGSSASTSTSTRPIRCCAARCSPIAASTSSAKRSTSRRSCAATRPAASGCCPKARRSSITVRDSRDKVVDERIVKVNALEHRGVDVHRAGRGRARQLLVSAILESDRPKPAGAGQRPAEDRDERDYRECKKTVTGSFLVAAYRRPDFRVDVTLTGDSRIAGDPLNGVVTARYLFGAPMGKRPAHWTLHAHAGLFGARRDHRQVPRRALDVRRLSRTRTPRREARDGRRTRRR